MLHHAALKLCFWLMHMFEILKFEFVVWMDLNSIEKIKRKENRNFRIKEKAKTAQDALSLDLFVQARMRSLSLHGGTRLSVSFLSPTRVPVAPSPSASPVPPIGAARSLACPLLRGPLGHACQPCPPQPSARTTHAHAVDSAPTMHTKATPAPTRPFLAARTPTPSPPSFTHSQSSSTHLAPRAHQRSAAAIHRGCAPVPPTPWSPRHVCCLGELRLDVRDLGHHLVHPLPLCFSLPALIGLSSA
jgi:hypothetical protein